jgi:hypothetical protein
MPRSMKSASWLVDTINYGIPFFSFSDKKT